MSYGAQQHTPLWSSELYTLRMLTMWAVRPHLLWWVQLLWVCFYTGLVSGPVCCQFLPGSNGGWHSDPGCSPGWCGTVVDRTGSHCGLLRDQYGTTKDFDHLSDESHESILCIKNMIALQWQCDRCTRRTDETVGREKVNTDKIGNWNQPVKVRLGIRHCFQRCHRSRIHRKCHLIGLSYIKGRGMSDSWVSVLDK